MRTMKQLLAVALATTMVISSCVMAFADDPVTNGSSTGTGTSEGHVEKKATNVVLPTIAEGSTPFAYTMDPERLIAETSNAKYGDSVIFPTTGDTGVYFNNGPKGGDGADKDKIVYANSSKAQTVTNKSSHAVNLTVSVAASNAETDIPLVASDAIADAEAASLYLGLKVGSETPVAISTAAAATKTVSIAGTEGNFKIAVKADNSGYEYRALTLDEYKALEGNSSKTQDDYDGTWATADFQLEGAVTEDLAITSTTTAPTVTVTWSWEDPTVEPEVVDAAPSIATTSYAAGTDAIEVDVNLGVGELAATGIASITFEKNGATSALSNTKYTFSDGKLTFNADYVSGLSATRAHTITFNDANSTTVVVTLTK